MSVTFDGAKGEGTDTAIAVIYDELTRSTFYDQAARADAVITVSIAGLDPSALGGLHAYLVFSRALVTGTAEAGQVSSTAYLKVPA